MLFFNNKTHQPESQDHEIEMVKNAKHTKKSKDNINHRTDTAGCLSLNDNVPKKIIIILKSLN